MKSGAKAPDTIRKAKAELQISRNLLLPKPGKAIKTTIKTSAQVAKTSAKAAQSAMKNSQRAARAARRDNRHQQNHSKAVITSMKLSLPQ